MSKLLTRELIAEQAAIVEAPRKRHEVDRTFELPKGLYAATVALYLGFLAIMATGMSSPGLIIPMAIFTVFIVAGFGIPAIWTRLAPQSASKQMSFAQLRRDGISTLTGRLPAKDAAVQMLILPAIIFCWGIATITIAAVVR
ncbi:hypothetical protein KUW15_05780 [Qipengyuania aquimaris]|uniref:Uncharacterized protein n=1 Tax=Qipengyuania xiapuensis TaxID=2867236 RepID=A0ABX8ZW46_9SPHN|nr:MULTISPECIES: hypothetical protein [Qipengyuania]MBY6128220.1 hypothetical protein [Qipengyuania aquimaris]QZD93231.1 hypothetical protein K3162_04165 [Qipengyuania xiapuensis]UOR15348.1 hypothetical protein LCM05_12835 [Qipengyuania aquimaris]